MKHPVLCFPASPASQKCPYSFLVWFVLMVGKLVSFYWFLSKLSCPPALSCLQTRLPGPLSDFHCSGGSQIERYQFWNAIPKASKASAGRFCPTLTRAEELFHILLAFCVDLLFSERYLPPLKQKDTVESCSTCDPAPSLLFLFFFFFKPNCWVPSSCCSSAVFYMKHFYWILGFRGLGFFCACWGLCWFFQFVELPWNCNPLICHCCCTRQAPALCRLNNFICHKVIGDSGVGQIQARHFPAHQRVW